MPPHSDFASSPSSSAFSACSALNASLRSSHFRFSNFHFRRKPIVSPPYTRPAHNPFLSPTYAKTGGCPLPKNVGAPTFSIFPLIFYTFSPDLPSEATARALKECWHKSQRYIEDCRDKTGKGAKRAGQAQPLQRRVWKREVAAGLGLGGIGGGGDVAGGAIGGYDFFEGWLHVMKQGLDAPHRDLGVGVS